MHSSSSLRYLRVLGRGICCGIALAFFCVAARAQWVTAYYINTSIPVNQIPWSKATHVIDLGLSPTDSVGDLGGIAGSDADAFTSAAHAAGVKALVCVRDADGNIGLFGQAITSNLNGFVGNIVNFVNTHNYDGVDLDWEAGNFNGGDNVNYINLINALRSALGSSRTITMSIYWNYGLANVVQNTNSAVNQYNVMCYDMDQWNSDIYYNLATYLAPGDTVHNSCSLQAGNFTGYAPAAKIGLGIPFYGRVWNGCADSGCSDGLHSLGQTWASQTNNPISYASLVASSYWSLPHSWDSTRGASYISLDQSGASNDRFISYTDSQQINSMVQLMKSGGYGGVMEYEIEYDLMPGQTGDAMHPLATAVWSAIGGATTTPPPPTNSAPVVSSGSPTGTLASTTTSTTMTVATNENATCKYATSAGMAYSSMTNTFSTTGGTSHSTSLNGLSSGNTYATYVKCSSSGVADTSDYQVSFTVASAPSASSSVTFSPTSGSGSSQTFTAQIVDTNGASTITQVDLIIGTVGATNSCWVEYGGPGNPTLYLRDDSNNWLSAGLGSGTVLKNSQCSLNTGTSTASTSGAGTQLTVNFAMAFTSSYAGAQPLVTEVADSAGWVTGFVTQGTYSVTTQVTPPPPAPALSIKVSPNSGSGSSAKFAVAATDAAGFAAVSQIDVFIGTNMGAPNQCYLDYAPGTRTLSLLSSDTTHWISSKIGTSTSIQNSVCSVNLNGVTATGSGNTLTLTIPVNFSKNRYAGVQGIWTFGADSGGTVANWQNQGSWNVP